MITNMTQTNLSKITIRNIALVLLCFFPFSLFLGNGVVEVTICSIGILFLITSLVKKDFNWLHNEWVKAALIFWVYLCIRSLWASDPIVSLARGAPFIRYIMFACAISFWLIPKNSKLVIHCTLASILLFSLSAITQYFIGHDFFGNQPHNLNGYLRLTNYTGKMSIGISIAMLLFPALSYLLSKNIKFALFLIIISGTGIFLSGERTAFLIFILGVVTLFILHKKYRSYLVYCAILGIVIFTGFTTNNSATISRQINSTFNEIKTLPNTSYGLIYSNAFELFKQNPVFGIGLRHFQSSCLSDNFEPKWLDPKKPHLNKNYLCTTHPHNIFLEILAETGIIGISLFLWIIICWIKYVALHFQAIRNNPIKVGAALNIALKLVPIAASSSLFIAWPTAPLWFMVGLLYAREK